MPTIIEMVGHTRLDCVLGSTAGMRTAVEQAIHHARHRAAFGKLLIDQPLMRNVLADLAVESEAATVLAMRLARAYDEAAGDEGAVLFKRLATAVAKYWVCKRGPGHAAEAMECLGGNGYTEEWPLARVYREQPLLSIWEGSGNVIALDVLRAMARTPAALGVLLDEIERGGRRRRRAWTPTSRRVDAAHCRTPRRWSRAPGGSSRTWRSRCRARCWCATRRRRSPTRSAPRAWPATAACLRHAARRRRRRRDHRAPRRAGGLRTAWTCVTRRP